MCIFTFIYHICPFYSVSMSPVPTINFHSTHILVTNFETPELTAASYSSSFSVSSQISFKFSHGLSLPMPPQWKQHCASNNVVTLIYSEELMWSQRGLCSPFSLVYPPSTLVRRLVRPLKATVSALQERGLVPTFSQLQRGFHCLSFSIFQLVADIF